MAETLGSLCDKLTVIKLKQFHSDDNNRLSSLLLQEKQLIDEIDLYISNLFLGNISIDSVRFVSNKIYKKEGNETREFIGDFGFIFSELAKINCDLWHEQEKVYDFENIAQIEKDKVIKRLAVLNLERNKCIDEINNIIYKKCKS